MFVVGSVQGQFTHLKEGKYKAFNGTEHEVYILEGKFTVSLLTKGLLVNSQLSDTAILFKMRDEIDGYYQGYKELFGIEPAGGNPNYQNKTNCRVFVEHLLRRGNIYCRYGDSPYAKI